MKIAKWGNSLAVRLPASLVEEMGLKESDEIALHSIGKGCFEVEKKPSLSELLASVPGVEGCVPVSFMFSREGANER